jgi:hypothetical protein
LQSFAISPAELVITDQAHCPIPKPTLIFSRQSSGWIRTLPQHLIDGKQLHAAKDRWILCRFDS